MRTFCYLLTFVALAGPAQAGIILDRYGTGTPEGSWAYSKAVGVGKNNSVSYVPVRSDYSGAIFQGYVAPDQSGTWDTVPAGSVLYDEDSIRIFTTYIMSMVDTTVSLRLDGDDGHSAYINDSYIDGGDFDADIDFDLSLVAGEAVKLEIAGYNGPGPWLLQLKRQEDGLGIVSSPGITINAAGSFAVVPEPSTLIPGGIGLVCCLGYLGLRRYTLRSANL